MRTLEEIQKDYSLLCAQLGDFEFKVAQTRTKILDKLSELDAEAGKVKEVQAELEKAKTAEAAKEVAPEAPATA